MFFLYLPEEKLLLCCYYDTEVDFWFFADIKSLFRKKEIFPVPYSAGKVSFFYVFIHSSPIFFIFFIKQSGNSDWIEKYKNKSRRDGRV